MRIADRESGELLIQESGVSAQTPWRLSPQMQYGRVFPEPMRVEQQITSFGATSAATWATGFAEHIGGYFSTARELGGIQSVT
jgi:hypothetical protein